MSANDTSKVAAPTWDIESIFPGGSDSEQFADFRKQIAADLKKSQKELESLDKQLNDSNRQDWANWILNLQSIAERIHHADIFCECLTSQNVDDTKALQIQSQLHEYVSTFKGLWASLESFSIRQSDSEWNKLLSMDGLKEIEFKLHEMRDEAKDKMPEEMEKLALELSVSGFHSWNMLYDKMAGDLRVEVEEDGEKKLISLGQNANRLSNPDRAIRKDAFEKMESAWESRAEYAAMALNSLVGFRLTVYRKRGWDSFLKESLQNSRITEDTLNAMWQAVIEDGAKIKEYTDAKKKLLDIDNFCWYDQTATIGKSGKKYTFGEAGDFIVKHLGSFSDEMGNFTRRALDNRWVEAEDRAGKRGGAWCGRMPLRKESRIFMTFSGTYSSLETLAHELGHGYHGYVLKDIAPFSQDYPMTLAETASIFNELRVSDAAYNAAESDEERLMLLDQKLQGGFTFFCNIRARFLFDTWMHEERKEGTLIKDRLNELMTKAQKEAFFGILDEEEGLHPLFWCSKLHFYLTMVPFYNYPYTFGFLFANGVYDRALKEGSDFAQKYHALLADSGKMTSEEVARKHLGVDLTKVDFWKDAVNRVLADVPKFIELC